MFGSGTAPTPRAPGQDDDIRIVFVGRILSDFTIVGWFSEIQALEQPVDSENLHMLIEFADAPDGSHHPRLTRIYDPPSSILGAIWHPVCFVPVADIPADGVVRSEMCPDVPSNGNNS